jgi:hypothetical protein
LTPELRAKILAKTYELAPDGSTHWSLRKMAAVMKVGKELIRKVWKEADLKPHRLERYLATKDPQFEKKAADIIALYLNPPQHAAVFCVDEKSAIRALDRKDRRLPLSPGRAERHGFEYHRHGTLSLFAALNTKTGSVIGQTASRHTSKEFVDFLEQVVATCPPDQEIHYHPRQSPSTQDRFGEGFPCGSPQCAIALHANVLVMAESGGDLVRKAARDVSRAASSPRSPIPPQDHALHPALGQDSQAVPVKILRSISPDSAMVKNSPDSPLVTFLWLGSCNIICVNCLGHG